LLLCGTIVNFAGYSFVCLVSVLVAVCHGLYSATDDVYELNPSNFDKMVVESHFVWIVEFYAPW